jgi:hypothetical protein
VCWATGAPFAEMLLSHYTTKQPYELAVNLDGGKPKAHKNRITQRRFSQHQISNVAVIANELIV